MTFRRPVALAASALALVGLLAVASGVLANQAAVSIVDKTFTPKDLTVQVGNTVVWTVTKSIGEVHTVTSGTSGGTDVAKVFDSKFTLKDNGQTFSWTFATAGSFAYFCQVHPAQMTGTITVLAPGQTAPPAASGAPAASEAPGAAEHPPVSTSDKLTAAGILVAVIVLLFGSAWYYRRINRPG